MNIIRSLKDWAYWLLIMTFCGAPLIGFFDVNIIAVFLVSMVSMWLAQLCVLALS